jgi:hypothetical protein
LVLNNKFKIVPVQTAVYTQTTLIVGPSSAIKQRALNKFATTTLTAFCARTEPSSLEFQCLGYLIAERPDWFFKVPFPAAAAAR